MINARQASFHFIFCFLSLLFTFPSVYADQLKEANNANSAAFSPLKKSLDNNSASNSLNDSDINIITDFSEKNTVPVLSSTTPKYASSPTHSESSFLLNMATKTQKVVSAALNLIGVRYQFGGNTPEQGIDCSAYVKYIFQKTLGLNLPRRAQEMSHMGSKVKLNELEPGDLVFFNTRGSRFSHVGISIGGDKFVHSPSTGSTVRVDLMSDHYWNKRFTGARRILTSTSVPDESDDTSGNI